MSLNQKQVNALQVLVNRINAERPTLISALDAQTLTVEQVSVTTDEMGKAYAEFPIPGFPVVSIGKQGGYDMPMVRSYPQENGKTALDACVYGDWHLLKQHEGRKKGRALPY